MTHTVGAPWRAHTVPRGWVAVTGSDDSGREVWRRIIPDTRATTLADALGKACDGLTGKHHHWNHAALAGGGVRINGPRRFRFTGSTEDAHQLARELRRCNRT